MKAILSQSYRVIALGALLAMAKPPTADCSPAGASGISGGSRQLVLQVRGKS